MIERIAMGVMCGALLLLPACTHTPAGVDRGGHASSPTTSVSSPVTEIPTAGTAAPEAKAPELLVGTGKLVGPPPAHATKKSPPSDGIQLQFVDTEIAAVVASVIGEGLGAPYVVDPSVKGTMTLQSSRPLTASELVPALESALQLQGFAITNADGTYRVGPMKDAPRAIRGLRGPDAKGHSGYSIEIVPMQFVSALEMQKTLEPFAAPGGILRVDEGRNILLIAGTGQEIDMMLDVVKTFDVDWLAGMSFGLFSLNYVDAPTLAGELKEVFADPRSPLNGIVRLVPISRLNALLVVTPQARYLSDVERWIKRLDLGGAAPGRRIYVYDVQNAKAGDLAKSLNRILSLSGAEPSDTSTMGPAPSSGPTGPRGGFGSGMGSTVGSGGSLRTPDPSGGGMANALSPGTPGRSLLGATAQSGIDTGGLRIVPNDENNSLLILASPSEFGVIEAALKRLDVPPRQVLIEATLAEVTLTQDLKYGVQWSVLGAKGAGNLSQSSSGSVSQAFPGFSYLFTGSTTVKAVLNAIESITKVNILSNPKLMVLNNHEAEMQIGDQVPIATQSAVSVVQPGAPIVNSVQLLDTGVILRVTPRVNQSGLVQLEITQEVSNAVSTTTSGIDSPTVQQRKITSTVSVRSGDTIALGGLISETVTRSKGGVPFLNRIPLLGALFGNSDRSKDRTELIVLITPRVIRDDTDLHDAMADLRYEFRSVPNVPLAKPP